MSTKSDLIERLKDKEFRHAYLAARIQKDIPFQIRALRKKLGWSQKELAEKAGMKQSRISLLENPNYEKGYQTETLRRIAAVFDVALIVRLGPFSEVVDWTENLSPESFTIPSFEEDFVLATVKVSPQSLEHEAESDWEATILGEEARTDDAPSALTDYPTARAA
ncbi:MAG: helix-turn-helix transcriptional regulator [Deltaproteobacteria bacterium]|nr:helix-turn-helix transcriptional regulator [Deltaproteobacteria bacterium]